MDAAQLRSLAPALSSFLDAFRGHFVRAASFAHCRSYLTGLLSDLSNKSVEPMALAADTPPRTLQEFLSQFKWDHEGVWSTLRRRVAARPSSAAGTSVGVIDACAHPKRGDKTPGVARQYCGQTGKVDNCVVGQHLLYFDGDAAPAGNPFSCLLASDLLLPKAWSEDRDRCEAAKIPDDVVHLERWRVAIDQVRRATGDGVRFGWITFDAEFGDVPAFWFGLDAMGQRAVGEVRRDFRVWTRRPSCRSFRGEHAPRRVDNLLSHSPVFRAQPWLAVTLREGTRGPVRWEVKSALVRLPRKGEDGGPAAPTEREYWLIAARNPGTGEVKHMLSNAGAGEELLAILRAAFTRWPVEQWFERAKNEAGFGCFEVRTYQSLVRHWLCSTLAMLFLAEQTQRLRGEKPAHHPGADRPRDARPGERAVQAPLAFA
jgi:SRSO17 transposase